MTTVVPPLAVLESAVDTLLTVVEQREHAPHLGCDVVVLRDAVELLATDPDAGEVELVVVTEELTRLASLLTEAAVPTPRWAPALLEARRAVHELTSPHREGGDAR